MRNATTEERGKEKADTLSISQLTDQRSIPPHQTIVACWLHKCWAVSDCREIHLLLQMFLPSATLIGNQYPLEVPYNDCTGVLESPNIGWVVLDSAWRVGGSRGTVRNSCGVCVYRTPWPSSKGVRDSSCRMIATPCWYDVRWLEVESASAP